MLDGMTPRPVAAGTLGNNLARIREGKRLSRRALAGFLAASGQQLPEISLRRIEGGFRSVSVEELLHLAAVLDVCPVDLVVPGTWDDDTLVQVTDTVTATAGRTRAWIGGRALLNPPLSAAQLAAVIQWMPATRARAVAKAWSCR